ncbi:MAG: fatty acyl-AMP ligase [Magnetococcales bacterium]|nr:AMP-binding protein [Magnetococcales bacterium]NGZ06011.1 fatty acyl-AMP ligase [Magnetococcales bacterium]
MIEGFLNGLHNSDRTLFWLHVSADSSGQRIDAETFLREIHRWASCLRNHPEPVVAILGRMTLAMTSAWFGAIVAGKLPAFLSHPSRKMTSEEFARKLANYHERFGGCVVVGEALDREVVPTLLTPDALSDVGEEEWRMPGIDPRAPLFLQCSSGTTGLQKAVAITSAMLTAQVQSYARAVQLDPVRDVMISWLPLYHDMGLAGVFLPALLTRTPLHLLETFEWAANPGWLLAMMEQERATLCWLPNFAFSWLARVERRHDLGSVRAFINCSEPVTPGAFDRFLAATGVRPHALAVCYALAEHVFAATQSRPGVAPGWLLLERAALTRRQVVVLGQGVVGGPLPAVDASGSVVFACGQPVSGAQIRIVCRSDEEGIGEIWLSGPSAVTGYHGQGPLRDDGWLPTGDLGFMRDGVLYVTGRIKDLIIHNGKNLYPVDLEETVGRSDAVHPGRVVAMGRMDAGVDSEAVLVLFEPARPLSVVAQQSVCATLQRELDAVFDIRSEVVCVPRNWLRKTSSGKLARQENLRRYESGLAMRVHLVGDSHVRLFWSGPTSHHNRYRAIHAHWLGLFWSENWPQTRPFLANLIARLGPTDLLIIACGEPECRSIFPEATDPEARIMRSVAGYQELFAWLRRIWAGRLAYMTGIPTHPVNIDNGDAQWPVCGTPDARYHWQERFYRQMYTLCTAMGIHFLDVCTPLLEADGRMDPARLCDKAHLDVAHEGVVLAAMQERFGYMDLTPNDPAPEERIWDGSHEHYLELMRLKVRAIQPWLDESDWTRLVSGGVLDSVSIVELIAMLNRTFHFQLDPAKLRRADFESLERIWERFGP